MIWIKFLSKLIKVLNDGATPKQISGGLALGMLAGMTPSFPADLLIFFLILIVNVNISMALLAIAVFKLVSWTLDPLANALGYYLLVDAGALKSLWTAMYNIPLVPFTKYNNTLVLGSFLIALALFVPVVILGARGVVYYREHLMDRFLKWKVVKALKASKLYMTYENIRDYTGG